MLKTVWLPLSEWLGGEKSQSKPICTLSKVKESLGAVAVRRDRWWDEASWALMAQCSPSHHSGVWGLLSVVLLPWNSWGHFRCMRCSFWCFCFLSMGENINIDLVREETEKASEQELNSLQWQGCISSQFSQRNNVLVSSKWGRRLWVKLSLTSHRT